MAFDFIKKVFSFGRKEAVEEKSDEAAPLPPLNFDALKPAESESAPSEPVPEIQPQPAPETEPAPPPEQPATPEPQPQEPPAKPQEIPPEPVRPEPEPAKPEPPEVPPAPAPRPEKPEIPAPAPEVPKPPAEVPASPPQEEPAAPPVEIPAEPEQVPAEVPVEVPPSTSLLRGDTDAPAEALAPDTSHEDESEPAAAEEIEQGIPAAPVDAVEPQAEAEQAAVAQPPVEIAPEPKPAAGRVTVTRKVAQKEEVQPAPVEAPRKSWFQRMKEGLSRSSRELSGNIAGVFTKRKLDEDTLQDLEDVLIRADLGVETALRVTDALAASRYGKDVSDAEVRTVMATEVEKVLGPVARPLELDLSHKPHVILVVGVNGTGKTTTIGKLAAKLTEGGLSVMLAAGDTFRAAAIEQLKIWGERTGSPVIATKLGADAAGLAYDAFEQAKAAGSDVLIIDTAGRLQNKAELMAELEKIVRVLGKLDPEAPHTVLQTVDATTGQNALNQVEIFRNVAGVNGLVMTKLDGTARGGILVAIAAKHKLPVYFIGVGEQVDDLEPFSAGDFAKAIAGIG